MKEAREGFTPRFEPEIFHGPCKPGKPRLSNGLSAGRAAPAQTDSPPLFRISSTSLSAIMAINSLLVGFPLALLTV